MTVNPLVDIEVNDVLNENYVDDNKSKLEMLVIAFIFAFPAIGDVYKMLYDGMLSVYVFNVVNAIHVPDRLCGDAVYTGETDACSLIQHNTTTITINFNNNIPSLLFFILISFAQLLD